MTVIKKSIANRWLVNTFGVIVFLLLIINVVARYMIQSYYYSSASTYIQSQANIISSVLARYYDDIAANYSSEIRNTVENFDKKEYMELMAINSLGRVSLTSSGFSPASNYSMPDYEAALKSDEGTGTYTGALSNTRENVMAVTVIINRPSKSYSAIRLVSSMDKIDAQINFITVGMAAASLGVILLVFLSGMYFIKSIIFPLRQIGVTAEKLAAGDFTVRIPVKTADEIGQLSTVFNNMADELENTETIKNDFISSVSHELRTPLTAIKGWGETLTDIDDPATVRKGMKVITSETQRLSDMVEELLDFSRIQNGRFTLQKTNMDVLAELADALMIYTEKAKQDGIRIIYDEPESFAVIFGDKNRIRQVFINIIDNAIKYTDNGGEITVDVKLSEEKIVISISDTGAGIAAEDLPKIKTKFYKANSLKRGSGIGLAVADEIVHMHGGVLEITSEQGVGTTVIISLPLVKRLEPNS